MTGERSGQQKTPVDVRVSIVARSFAQPAEPERLYTSEVRASWHPVAGIHEASAIRMGFTSDLIGFGTTVLGFTTLISCAALALMITAVRSGRATFW